MPTSTTGKKGRGRLKIYLGMAAGVGKTYSMLSDALADIERGLDVAIGFVQPHGRKETEGLAAGIEQIPLREFDYRGVKVSEFNIDEALNRHPQVLLVDELAHTNAPDSRHAKRWQDVQELLESGIDIRTTVNIQHVESLRDVVAQITGVFVQETVPDAFFDEADEIELVDLPPEELHQRLQEGKVYVPEKVEQALTGFFKRSNLLALRELALRHTAERVDEEMRKARSLQQTSESWHAKERILVCVAPNRMALRVVRAARRLAANLHSDWYAVSVDSPRQGAASERNRQHLDAAMSLAESLGAKTATLAGEDIVAEVLRFAREENVTTIIVGKPIRKRWRELLFGSVVDSLIRASGEIDVLVITGSEELGTSLIVRRQPGKPGWKGYIFALGMVLLCTAIGFAMLDKFDPANIVMVYLLGVTITSASYSRNESLLAATLSVLAFDICFVHPRGTLAVSDAQYLLTFGIMLIVSLMISSLTQRLKEQSAAASQRERNTATLYDLSRQLASLRNKQDMARVAAEKAVSIVGVPVAVLVRNSEGHMEVVSPSISRFESEANEMAVCAWVADQGKPAGNMTDTLAGARGLHLPLLGSGGTLGTLSLDFQSNARIDTARRHLLEAIAHQLAGGLERAQFAKESNESALKVESESMRSDLLSAVSHDLRTPLASIVGAASVLAEQSELTIKSKELALTVVEESERMGRLIRNLLDMTRVQGAIELSLDWYGLDEILAEAIARTESFFVHPAKVEPYDKQILLKIDGVLIQQVFVNLLENAARHAGKEVHVAIRMSTNPGYAIVEIEDDGPGIPEGKEEAIFERFHRRGNSGFGLGLAICKAAVEAHGGRISLVKKKSGACFRIELPMTEITDGA